ncbi:MAG: non-canonical purine NTP pyrophosphatase [Myxococcales bacterium]|nr:non-canonical purine NTP pyrophosphatase [Deltaproteobacteria bacterium]NNL26711.1 non-canonical purine NTP pyrophosphatase [Myxococcales bacterium]RZV55488.1 MAG: non-canonical purine NTP pyrophosphatase [Deltaproteobacteria bacterium]
MTGHSDDWVLATHNSGKTQELQDLFASLPIRLTSAKDLELPEPDETGTTFEANAELKALAAAKATGRAAIADDSGVAVHALGGEPGIHTALWAGEPRDFDIARRRVEARLVELGEDVSRRATYICVLCVAWPDGRARTFRGETRGTLVWPIRGELGHGFEPMFLPDGFAITYGEMTAEQRRRVNARAAAMRKLEEALFRTAALRADT